MNDASFFKRGGEPADESAGGAAEMPDTGHALEVEPGEAPVDPDATGDWVHELAQLNDRHVRLLAEFDNFRRRSIKERDEAVLHGIERLARPLLEVLDNLERALAQPATSGADALRSGVELTAKQFAEALKSVGVEPVDPLGQPFDPRWHEALGSVEAPGFEADSVAQVVTRGYRLGDRVLRPARVLVARGADGS
jgi:molecular chaperone GrpE